MGGAAARPAWWLPGRHLQTMVPALVPTADPGAEPLVVPVAPGNALRLAVTRPPQAARGTVILVHGLAGSESSPYMRRAAARARERGFVAVRVNLRNCGGTEALATTLYNAAQSGDADRLLEALETHRFPRPFLLCGFSLGGNLALRYAALSGTGCRADAVCGVNPPVDLAACVAAIERPGNVVYQSYFTLCLCAQIRAIRRRRAVPGPPALPWAVYGIRRFDEAFTAPDGGWADAAAYYADASAAPILATIRRPTLVLSAANDPLVPAAMFRRLGAMPDGVRLAFSPWGGHVGYWRAGRPRFWAADAAIDFFESAR